MDGSADWVQITSPSCGEKLCDYQMSTEITIGDNTPPTAVAQDISVQIDINTGLANIVAADIDNGSSDNCTGGITLSLSTTEFTCADMGVNLVTLTVEDASGNISTADATVTVTSSINDEVVSATNQILCGAGSSTSITTGSSVVGVNYYLKNSANNTEVDGPIAGTGNGLNFNTGAINSLTTFKVTGYIPSSASCEFEMSQTATISIHPTYNLSETVSVCNGVSYTFPDGTTQNNITAQVIHVSNLVTNITACDSVITTTVNISSSYNLTETVAVCNGGSYTFQRNVNIAVNRQRTIILADLITFGQVGIKIALTRKLIEFGDFAIQRQTDHHAVFHRLTVNDGKRTRHSQRQRIDSRVGRRFDAIHNRAIAEHFGVGQHLGVNF
jgi:hypothetical protein